MSYASLTPKLEEDKKEGKKERKDAVFGKGSKADFGAAGMTVTEDRLKNIDFTDSYAKAKQVIITRK